MPTAERVRDQPKRKEPGGTTQHSCGAGRARTDRRPDYEFSPLPLNTGRFARAPSRQLIARLAPRETPPEPRQRP
jgi:hypothetical protein